METRASYIAVGTFVLLAAFGLAAFVVWLGASSLDQSQDRYRIFFSGSVTGLQQGSQVRYRGVPVGGVERIRINPDNLQEIEVTVALEPGTPIVEDNVARLDLQGLAGGVYVLISGGSQDSPPLEPVPGLPPPIIESVPAPLEQLYTSVPALIDQANQVLSRAEGFLSAENSRAFQRALGEMTRVLETLADDDIGLPAVLSRVDDLSGILAGLASEARVDVARLSDRVDTSLTDLTQEMVAVAEDMQTVSAEVRQLAAAYSTVGNQVSNLLAQARPGLEEFTQTGLYEFTLMTSELRGLAQTLSRLANRFERDPARFLLGEPSSGVRIE